MWNVNLQHVELKFTAHVLNLSFWPNLIYYGIRPEYTVRQPSSVHNLLSLAMVLSGKQ
jgi:hypothetical protein